MSGEKKKSSAERSPPQRETETVIFHYQTHPSNPKMGSGSKLPVKKHRQSFGVPGAELSALRLTVALSSVNAHDVFMPRRIDRGSSGVRHYANWQIVEGESRADFCHSFISHNRPLRGTRYPLHRKDSW